MTITEFAESRGILPQTVSVYIRRHPEFNGHTTKDGKCVVLDEEALKILDAVYPLPKPIEVIEDTENLKKLAAAQELIIRLQQQLAEQTEKVAIAEAMQLLLEDKEKQLEEIKQQYKTMLQKLEEQEMDAEKLRLEKARLLNRSLWQRIINKDT